MAGLVILGAILSAWLAWDIQKPVLWLIYPVAVFLLWSYSPLPQGNTTCRKPAHCLVVHDGGWHHLVCRTGGHCIFAQLPSPIGPAIDPHWFFYLFLPFSHPFPEMVKDCEDMEGYAATAQQTLPVRFGLHRVKRWALAGGLLLEIALLLLAWYFHQTSNVGGIAYTLSLLAIPQLAGLWFLYQAQAPAHYRRVSRMAKWVIFAGVFMVLFLP
ncbi:MAG: hypothetical protein IPJ40_23470 [Saprospirales bacterium]|nr:hypothetical protein [Saprospirales bacterium]